MSGFAVDHVVLRVPDPDGLAGRVSEATGLPVLRGWTPDGVVRSRGVRFANGPFLDIHEAPEPQPAWLGLRGPVAAAERLARLHGWRLRDGGEGYPWRIRLFRRGQAALTACFLIEYLAEDPAWAREEFSGELFAPAAGEGARLVRLAVSAPEAETAAGLADLLPAEVEVRIGGAPEVTRLEARGPARTRLQLTPALTLEIRPGG